MKAICNQHDVERYVIEGLQRDGLNLRNKKTEVTFYPGRGENKLTVEVEIIDQPAAKDTAESTTAEEPDDTPVFV
jgi:hypothetical protein